MKVVTYKFVGDDDDEAETFLLGAREMEDTVDGLKVYSPQSPLGSAIIGARGRHRQLRAPTARPSRSSSTRCPTRLTSQACEVARRRRSSAPTRSSASTHADLRYSMTR